MKKTRITRYWAVLLAVILSMTVVPFAGAEENEAVMYKLTDAKIESETLPVVSKNYVAIGSDIFDANGDIVCTVSADETVFSLGDNCVITMNLKETGGGGYTLAYHVYEITDSGLSLVGKYSALTTGIMPYETGGEYTTVIHGNLELDGTLGFDVLDGHGKVVYSDHTVDTIAAHVGDGAVLMSDTDGNETIIYGFDGKVTKKTIEGNICDYFHKGLSTYSVIGENGKESFGIINSKGEVLVDAKYAYAAITENGYGVFYDAFVGTSDLGDGIHVIDSEGNVVFETDKDNYSLLEYYGDTILICDPFDTYAIKEVGVNTYPASGYYSYSELDYHFFAKDEETAGIVADSAGNVVLTDVFDFSAEGIDALGKVSGDLIAKSAADGKYHRYDVEGNDLYTYSAKTVYALRDGLAIAGNEYFEDVYLIDSNERALTSTHDIYMGGEIYENCDVVLFADVDDADGLTYTMYVLKNSTSPFADVDEAHWAVSYVRACYENGIMNGTGGINFSPSDKVSRAQVVTTLWRLAGEPEADGVDGGGMKFNDVADGTWYTDAVAWAAECGITTGVGGAYFAPDRTVTRGEVAAILYRYAEYAGDDVSVKADLSSFADTSELSDWNRDAFAWCAAEGIITGKTAGEFAPVRLAPTDVLTRAEIAAVLCRYGV